MAGDGRHTASRMFAQLLVLFLLCLATVTASDIGVKPATRCIMYLTGQHPIIPQIEYVQHVTHVTLAFLNSGIFHESARSEWPLFMSVDEVRSHFPKGTKVLVAIGGWGDTDGFSLAAHNATSRRVFAANVAKMLLHTGADGIDIDWEYPGGNGEDYKTKPNADKAWEIAAYPLLLAELRAVLGPKNMLSAAVPGLRRDMLAFTRETVPRIMRHVDFLNVMTYDLMNRRDTETKHHTSIQMSLDSLLAYIDSGAAPQKLNLGLAFYVKWFQTEHDKCAKRASPLGCPTLLLEDPGTGADMGRAGGFSWHDTVPENVAQSFAKALEQGTYDDERGAYSYWDHGADRWWTFDTSEAVYRKVHFFLSETRVGGLFAWGLGEDAPGFEHLDAMNNAFVQHRLPRLHRIDEL